MKRAGRLLVLVVVCGLVAGVGYGLYVFDWPRGHGGEALVTIAPGTSSRQIAAHLEEQGIISSRYAFEAIRMLRGGKLKAGEYRFDGPHRVGEVYEQIARGQVYTLTLTIPEGANIFDIALRVQAAKLGSYAAFLEAERKDIALVHGLDPTAGSLEGYLFPDTYHFAPSATTEQILTAMVRRFEQQAGVLGLEGNPHRLVTLASLLERETPLEAERPLVASVLLNRLERGMALDTDPTVIYATLLAGRYRGTIYQSDLVAESPYNTYKHPGLPPGPICNPGLVSLRAAMNPETTDYLYFVAAGSDPRGRSRFAKTLEEHEKNVAAYRQAIRNMGGK